MIRPDHAAVRAGALPRPAVTGRNCAFFPQLEILELLDHGGMGMIYKARQPQLNRIVALKILAPDLSGDPAFAERFSRRSPIAGQTQPLQYRKYLRFRPGWRLLLFPDGIRRWRKPAHLDPGQTTEPVESRRIVLEICQALQYAHEEGVIHRDIKPSNILIDKKGRVKIADFGLAKLVEKEGQDRVRPALTTTVMGTPHYIAPEQVETPALVDHRADLYSLGVVFYEMLSGELPLGRFDPPSRKSRATDARMDQVVLRALEKDPTRRYQTASEMRSGIESMSVPANVVSPVTPAIIKQTRPLGFLPSICADDWNGVACGFFLRIDQGSLAVEAKSSYRCPNMARLAQPRMPRRSSGRRLASALQLNKTQVPEVNRIIRRYQREFVGVERRHTEHTQARPAMFTSPSNHSRMTCKNSWLACGLI